MFRSEDLSEIRIPRIINKNNVNLYKFVYNRTLRVPHDRIDDEIGISQLWLIINKESNNTDKVLLDRVSSVSQGKSYLKNLTFCGDYMYTYLHIRSLFDIGVDHTIIELSAGIRYSIPHVRNVSRIFKVSINGRMPNGNFVRIEGIPHWDLFSMWYCDPSKLTIGPSNYRITDNHTIVKWLANEAYNISRISSEIAKQSLQKARANGNYHPKRMHTHSAKKKEIEYYN